MIKTIQTTPAKHKLGIFGGTYEGRILAEFCKNEGIDTVVSVATAYGNQLLQGEAHTGRMDAAEMVHWIRQEEITAVIDATHPFAQEVSRQLRLACTKAQVIYQRLIRDETQKPPADETISWVSSIHEAAALLKQELLTHPQRRALLTTGSKELSCFTSEISLLPRLSVRVLPSIDAIQACQRAGFSGKQIIAMQGPFSCAMNQAILTMVQADYLVTKESGQAGGFQEKLEAAKSCHCRVIAIHRPVEKEEGKNLEEIKQWLKGWGREIVLLGIGMGGIEQITWEGIQTLAHADAFLGAARMVESAKAICQQLAFEPKPEWITYKKEEMVSWLNEHPEILRPVILFSGDSGFYSGANDVFTWMKAAFPTALIRLIPGISSLSYFAAGIGRSWEKVEIISLHGREEVSDWTFADKKERFFLLDGEERLHQICRKLLEKGQEDALLWVGENLSYSTEKIICASPKEVLTMHFGKLLVAWVVP